MKLITPMELHKYSSYSSGLYFSPESVNTLRLHLPNGGRREMTHVRLSRDFVSGKLEDATSRGYFRKSNLLGVEFLSDNQNNFPGLVFTRKTIGEQLLELQFPMEVRVSYRGSTAPPQTVVAIGLFRGFLVTDPFQYLSIPLATLSAIEVTCV